MPSQNTANKLHGLTDTLAMTTKDEVVELTKRPEREIPAAAFDFSQGYAKLKLGEAEFAKAYLAKVKKVADTSKVEFRGHTAARLIGTLAGILDGEISRMAGDLPGAIAKFEQAVKLDDEMEYDEPEPLPFPARHWLGAARLEAGRAADAERVYREDLKDHPHIGWSLLGLQQALKAQSKPTGEVDADRAARARGARAARARRSVARVPPRSLDDGAPIRRAALRRHDPGLGHWLGAPLRG